MLGVATRIMKQMIEQFTTFNLFGRENYEYYARVTGRVLRVQDEWIISFRYPPLPRGKFAQQNYALQLSLETEKTWLQCECDRWGLIQEESHSTPALLTAGGPNVGNSAMSLGIIPEHSLLESCARLSVSLEGPSIFTGTTTNQSSCSSSLSGHSSKSGSHHHMTLEELRAVNRYAEIQLSLETEKTWLQCECDRWGLIQEESHSTPALLTAGGPNVGNSAMSLGIIPEHSLLESCARLSVSLEGPSIFYGHNNKSI
uniref:Uncharacterized protein n=1 Tax=Lutzomyia longipalpis TaxID=7200 RepID=A0A1B0CWD2_LUTLO